MVYPPFVYILYDECSEDVTGEYISAKYQWRNWRGALGFIAPPLREKLHFLKQYKNEIINLVLPHSNFWPVIVNVTNCSFRRIPQAIHNESFKDNNCSIVMSCAVVWFRRIHFQKQPPEVFLKKVFLKLPENSPENTCTGVSFPTLFLFLLWNIVEMDPSVSFCGPFAVK